MIYLIEDNGYAISVPVEIQTPGGDIARLVSAFPGARGHQRRRHRRARERGGDAAGPSPYARGGRGPVLIKAGVVRLHSHSESDDDGQYKSEAEREAEQAAIRSNGSPPS